MKMISSYTLPEFTMKDIRAFLERKEAYLANPTRQNKQKLFFYYDIAYTSIKHLVVIGLIPQSEMWNIIRKLKAIPEGAPR